MPINSLPDPSKRGSDMEAMLPYWETVDAICGGLAAMKKAGQKYLPMLEGEEKKYYDKRLERARFTNVFGDGLSSLALKPFEEPVALGKGTTNEFVEFATNVDGRGRDLQGFASDLFFDGLRHGITWGFVDYTRGVPSGATIAEEREMGARPFWVHYSALDVLAVYSEYVGEEERITHCRLRETLCVRDGFNDKEVERVRVFNHSADMARPTWEVWEKMDSPAPANVRQIKEHWQVIEGPNELSIDRIPLVPVIFGERRGLSWKVAPPLRDAVDSQIELYQQENGLKNVRILTAYPMLAANGLDELPEELAIGPGKILFGASKSAEMGLSSWQILEPNGQSLEFLREDVKDTIAQIRELCRVPLTPQSGNITVITAAVAAAKGTSAIQAWVAMLDKALENMFMVTAEWLALDNPVINVEVYDRFEIGYQDEDTKYLIEMMDKRIISHQLGTAELKRRGILGKDYNFEEDMEQIDEELLHSEEEGDEEPDLTDDDETDTEGDNATEND